ncbi:MAG: glycerol-3-phosphate 1-O-acyltransferase [Acidobacteria bacterium]|nr:MAG: glycerol-3-phosphate 1-O-acyltransferase [Acidobacteriota bacterium]
MTARVAAAVLVGYLAGSIPFGLILVKAARGLDIRRIGSGNIGATNALRAGGVGIGVATLLLDLLKGVAGFLGGRAVAGPGPGWEIGLLAAAPVVGHMFPPWLRFRGGKGVATALGVLLASDPVLLVPTLAVFLLLAGPSRRVSLGSLGAAVAAPAAAMWRHGSTGYAWGLAAIGLLVIFRHRDNVRRLLAGREPPIGGAGGGKAS